MSARKPDQICRWCSRPFHPRGTARLYCSNDCYHASQIKPSASVDARGRGTAQRLYPTWQPCEVCGGRSHDRHHRNSDRTDNSPANIAFLCRTHHHAAHRASDGKVGGGPRPRIVALLRDQAIARYERAAVLRSQGWTVPQIAAEMGVDQWSVHRWFRKYGQEKAS